MLTREAVEDKWAEANGLKLHYREWGEADAPPLLILHGITGHAWEFDALASSLADRYRVLALNQRGHGASTWAKSYSPLLMADDIGQFMDALGLERARLVGHSMGGVNSWWFAAREPGRVERLAMLDISPTAITSAASLSGLTHALNHYAQASYAQPEEAVADYLAAYTGDQWEQQRTFVINNVQRGSDGRWTWRFDARGLHSWLEQAFADEEAHWALLRQIECPTLIVRAADSPFTERAGMARMAVEVPRAQLVEIPRAGHDVHIDQLNILVDNLRVFLP